MIHRPAGSATKGGFGETPTRSTDIRRSSRLLGAIGRDFVPHGSVADSVESSENPDESPTFADPPPGRFCGEGATFREITARPSEIRRNLHLPGSVGRDFAPHRSVGDCVASSESREKTLRPAGRPSFWFCIDGGIQWNPALPAEIGRNRHLLGADGQDSVHLESAVRRVEFSENTEKHAALRIPQPVAHSEKRRCLRKFPESHQMLSEPPRNRRLADLVAGVFRSRKAASR